MKSKEMKFKCVLLVDDDEISNYITKKMIYHLGLAENVCTVSNGRQALEFIKRNNKDQGRTPASLDLILLDVNMPIMDGFQFLEEYYGQLQKDLKEIKIVMLTSSACEEDLERSKNFPIHGYMIKPLTSLRLERSIGCEFATLL